MTLTSHATAELSRRCQKLADRFATALERADRTPQGGQDSAQTKASLIVISTCLDDAIELRREIPSADEDQAAVDRYLSHIERTSEAFRQGDDAARAALLYTVRSVGPTFARLGQRLTRDAAKQAEEEHDLAGYFSSVADGLSGIPSRLKLAQHAVRFLGLAATDAPPDRLAEYVRQLGVDLGDVVNDITEWGAYGANVSNLIEGQVGDMDLYRHELDVMSDEGRLLNKALQSGVRDLKNETTPAIVAWYLDTSLTSALELVSQVSQLSTSIAQQLTGANEIGAGVGH